MPIQKTITTSHGFEASFAVLADMAMDYHGMNIVATYAMYKDASAYGAGANPITNITKVVPLMSVWSQEFLAQMGSDLEDYLIGEENGEFEDGTKV